MKVKVRFRDTLDEMMIGLSRNVPSRDTRGGGTYKEYFRVSSSSMMAAWLPQR